MPTAVADTIVITKAQRIDFHQRAVPRPMERMGKRSPRRMIIRSVTALNQISASFRSAEANVISGTKKTNTWRITTIAKSEMNSPAHVAREAFVGTNGRLGLRAKDAPRFSVSIDSIKMPQGTVWIQEIKAVLFAMRRTAGNRPAPIEPSQACRLEVQRKICEQRPRAADCSHVTPDDSARSQRASQNQDSSVA